ncbi:luciferin 4-monooxygenase [Anabrus simplex]|uniref:luciferin 4-monooxygenase n=1 Tax=Anabrus simplex TaxID=316456 RepID=UPI0035A3BC9E
MDQDLNVVRGDSPDWRPPNKLLGQYLLSRLKLHGDRIIQAYPQYNETVTAAVVAERAVRYAATLQSLGVGCGDRVVVCCGIHPHYSSLLLGTICCGAACATLNNKFDSGDLRRLMEIIQPKVVFSMSDAVPQLQPALSQLATIPKLIVLDDEDTWKWFINNKIAYHEPQGIDPYTNVAAIMCSSGTSGLPKAVQITQANLFTSLMAFKHKDAYVQADDIVVITSPLFWVTALLYSLASMDHGVLLVLEFGASEEHVLGVIQQQKATVLFTASNFALSIAKQPSLNSYDFSRLRIVIATGTAMAMDTQILVENFFGASVVQLYGMTEILIATGMTRKGQRILGSVGLLVPTMKLKIVDPNTGISQGCGKVGELLFKGPQVSPGYLNNPEATAATFDAEGWVHSGDIGYADSDGNIFVTGRIKDIMKYRGHHVSPIELESILLSHPEVLEAAVIGVPHPTDVEHPRAYVVLKPGASVTADSLAELVASQVAEHKWLHGGVCFVNSLPKSPTGKIIRSELRYLTES